SSNGRTLGSGPSSLGSNPSPAASREPAANRRVFASFENSPHRLWPFRRCLSMTSIDEQALKRPAQEARQRGRSGSGWYAWLARGGLVAKGVSLRVGRGPAGHAHRG